MPLTVLLGATKLRAMSIPDFLLDKRIVERNLANGLIKRADVNKAIKALPDVESNSEPCVLHSEEAEAEHGEGEAAEETAES